MVPGRECNPYHVWEQGAEAAPRGRPRMGAEWIDSENQEPGSEERRRSRAPASLVPEGHYPGPCQIAPHHVPPPQVHPCAPNPSPNPASGSHSIYLPFPRTDSNPPRPHRSPPPPSLRNILPVVCLAFEFHLRPRFMNIRDFRRPSPSRRDLAVHRLIKKRGIRIRNKRAAERFALATQTPRERIPIRNKREELKRRVKS